MINRLKLALILLFVWSFSVKHLYAQDIHFSQYYASPLLLNPSYTGMQDEDWRVMGNYRTQWRAIEKPYNTSSIAYDRKFYLYSEKFSGGIYFVNDQSGGINLTVNQLFLSLAYHKEVNYNEFHVGVQLGWVFKSIDNSMVTLPNQFDNTSGYFNSGLSSGEILCENLNYPDFNIGIAWSRKLYNIELVIGLSLHHIFLPKETFTEYDNFLYMRLGVQAGIKYDLTERIYISPYLSINYHRDAREMMIGSNIGYILPFKPFDINDVFVGLHYRDPVNLRSDALIFVAGLNLSHLYVGISYDVNISNLRAATANRGAFEFAFIYKGIDTDIKKKTIPCDRY